MFRLIALVSVVCLALVGCDAVELSSSNGSSSSGSSSNIEGETARVTRVIDGDTIEVEINGEEFRVRYVGVNTPERDEPCYQDAVDANRELVGGKTVILVRDTSNTDRFDRLLRYIYVGDIFVNESLVEDGYAEAVRYDPDDQYWTQFTGLEAQADRDGLGCHPTGIFDDGSQVR